MESKKICSGETHIDENAFHNSKSSININEIEINKIILFNKTSCGNKGSFKHYIGYRHKDETLSPLNVKLPQLPGYAKCFNNGDKLLSC